MSKTLNVTPRLQAGGFSFSSVVEKSHRSSQGSTLSALVALAQYRYIAAQHRRSQGGAESHRDHEVECIHLGQGAPAGDTQDHHQPGIGTHTHDQDPKKIQSPIKEHPTFRLALACPNEVVHFQS